ELEDTPALRKEVVRQIRRFRPDIVITSDPLRRYQQHRDHRIIGQVTLDAVFPYARDRLHFPDLYRSEGLEPHKVHQVLIPGADAPPPARRKTPRPPPPRDGRPVSPPLGVFRPPLPLSAAPLPPGLLWGGGAFPRSQTWAYLGRVETGAEISAPPLWVVLAP